jgi:hypothetical protein
MAEGFRQFPPVSAKPIGRKPPPHLPRGGFDIIEESDAPACAKGFPVFPAFPPDLFRWSLRRRRGRQHCWQSFRRRHGAPP